MNFLELCQRTRQEAGISGTGPASVLDQVGAYAKVVDWVEQAYEDIQNDRTTWTWRNGDFSFETQVDVSDYGALANGLNKFFEKPIKIYRTADGKVTERKIKFISYDKWQDRFDIGVPASNYPYCFTIAKDKSLRLAPAPDDLYTVSGEGQILLDTMTANDSIPVVPLEYHMAIVYKAAMYWAVDQEAEQERIYVENKYRSIMIRMRRDYLPKLEFGYESL